MKSEPSAFSIQALKRKGSEPWDGVRNYQARNFMRDEMKPGDLVLFYHSNAEPSGIAGIAKIKSASRPDPTAFDPKNIHFDPSSDPNNPRWWLVDVEFVKEAKQIISLDTLRNTKGLEEMLVLRKGQRLSIMPVNSREFKIIEKLI